MIEPPRNPTVFVLFGASGDLVERKILPALFYLFSEGKLPRKFRVIGFARSELSQTQFIEKITTSVRKKFPDAPQSDLFETFLELFSYEQGRYDDRRSFESLAQKISEVESEWGLCMSLLYYLAVPSKVYEDIFTNLKKVGLVDRCSPEDGWSRVIVEKPFGMDSKTAEALDERIGKIFKEEQIYRIDHYLAKDLLQSIVTFRFANNLFEQTWDNHSIERIDIRLLEPLGLEGRGGFYEGVGAFRDVGQNHLLQMLALVIMEQPESYQARDIRKMRARALKENLKTLSADEVKKSTFRAQYQGYREIEGVDPRSEIETYFRVQTTLVGDRWEGVPVTIESGKMLASYKTEIEITFRHPRPCLCPAGSHFKNRVIFRLTRGEEGIHIEFWTKKPGLTTDQEQRAIDFNLYDQDENRVQYVGEYAKLLLDAINGDQTLYVSTDEIREMWRFTDPIVTGWEQNTVSLEDYPAHQDEILKLAATRLYESAGKKPEFGIIGLGKMGSGLAAQLLEKGWSVAGWNRSPEPRAILAKLGLKPYSSISDLIASLTTPRVIWLMLPAGTVVDEILFGEGNLSKLLSAGDLVIDGGNSFYKDSIAREKKLSMHGIRFLDVGVSGGPSGARYGACLMIGGKKQTFEEVEILFKDLASVGGYRFFDGTGAGHFVKMIHNGIEYGMMQAIGEGFNILRAADFKLNLDAVADIYNHGSVIESRLIGWLKSAFELYSPDLGEVSGRVRHTGEGQWTVETARELGVEAKIIEEALKFRMESEKNPSYTGQVLSALRNQFGGHEIADR